MAERKSERGFAKLAKTDPQRMHEIASMGGSASGGNFKKDRQRASAAGREGGKR